MDTQHERISANTVVLALVALVVIAGIVMAALAFDALLLLVGGVIVLCVTAVALARVGVSLFSRWADAKVKIDTARYDFLQNMASKGVLPASGEYLWRSQLEAPAAPQKQLASPGSQIILNPNALRESAVNLLLFSCRLLGEDSNRIASGPECAEAGVTGYTGRTWSMIVNDYLKPKYEVVTVTGPIKSGGGTYVPESIGTVKKLHDMVMLNSAVDALPEVDR